MLAAERGDHISRPKASSREWRSVMESTASLAASLRGVWMPTWDLVHHGLGNDYTTLWQVIAPA